MYANGNVSRSFCQSAFKNIAFLITLCDDLFSYNPMVLLMSTRLNNKMFRFFVLKPF